jgi:aspartate aminotransferase
VSFAFPAIVDAVRHHGADVERMRRVFAERAALIHRLITAIPGFACPRPSGAFYVFPDVGAYFGRRSPAGREIDSALAFSQALLGEALVAVVPGEEFGECARRHVRLSFACGQEQIEQGVGRIAEWVAALR